jgi:hypothetical protein
MDGNGIAKTGKLSLSGNLIEPASPLAQARIDAVRSEARLIGTLIAHGHTDRVRRRIQAPDCRDPRHAVLLSALYALEDKEATINLASVIAQLENTGRIKEAGGVSYVVTLTNDPLPGFEPTLVEDVRGMWRRHDSIQRHYAAIHDAYHGVAYE